MECSICYDEMTEDTTKLKCGHTFHTGCIDRWAEHHYTCPYCRFVFHRISKNETDDMVLMMVFIIAYTYLFLLAAWY